MFTMDANEFIVNIKANNTENDQNDLAQIINEYRIILAKITTKDRGSFSLNVLCILCRNLDKAPKWKSCVDTKDLVTLSIECIRETRTLEKADRVKTLACIYHIHKFAVQQNKPVPPELILKLSFMPFELESNHLLQEYAKTYWNILVDRLTYIDRLKSKLAIIKLLPKLIEDCLKIIDIYDTVQFCSTLLVFLIKKLHFMFSDTNARELNKSFGEIFTKLSTKDLKPLAKLSDKDTLDLYVKCNDCFYAIAENSSKLCFKDTTLCVAVRTCISLVGHRSDLYHCLLTLYQNSLCWILSDKEPSTESLNDLYTSLETTERLYKTATYATYPFISQMTRLYIDYVFTKTKYSKGNTTICFMKLINLLMLKLSECKQLLSCDGCTVKSGLHDSLRLSFLIKYFASHTNQDANFLPTFFSIIMHQYDIITKLEDLGCVNYLKCFRKLQTDTHNMAILLNKSEQYQYSIKLFDLYLKHELKTDEYKNISRALYNKGICELDCKLYKKALIDAFLSLIYSLQNSLDSDKHMSLVMDIKAKELKSKPEDEQADTMQLFCIVDCCKMVLKEKNYGDLTSVLQELKFSVLLYHEFTRYVKLWPSIAPIAGVWRSLLDISNGKYCDWMSGDSEEEISETLYRVILETPMSVRTVHSDYYKDVILELLDKFEAMSDMTPDMKLVHASLLFLKCEYDLAEASQKYEWKASDMASTVDPDKLPVNRTIPREHKVLKCAIQAVELLTEVCPHLTQVSSSPYLVPGVQLFQVSVPLLLHNYRTAHALQLAHICCQIADCVGDHECYIRNAGILLYHSTSSSRQLEQIIETATLKWGELPKGGETSIIFICEAAIHYAKSGSMGPAAQLVQIAQNQILNHYRNNPDVKMDLAVGRLLEAQNWVCKDGPCILSSVNAVQRHYLSVCTTGSKWCPRRLHSLTLRHACAGGGGAAAARSARAARGLRQWARARGAAAAGLRAAAAAARALLYSDIIDTNCFDDAQTAIDYRLKEILGLQQSNATQPNYQPATPKTTSFTPKQDIETMLKSMTLKKTQTSPTFSCIEVPAFNLPDFFKHTENCDCFACDIPFCLIIALKISILESSIYFRAKEDDIAKNYFAGVLKMIDLVGNKLKVANRKHKEILEDFVVDIASDVYDNEFKRCQLEFLIELSYFELKNRNFKDTDDYIVRIHEISQEMKEVDEYINNEVFNLIAASAYLRNSIKIPENLGLEEEFENLKISPCQFVEPPKTPEGKVSVPKDAKIIVKDEELPKKRVVIKFELNDDSQDFEKPKLRLKKPEFKIPNPKTTKASLEVATPKPQRSNPMITVTDESGSNLESNKNLETPKNFEKSIEFFTPLASTPEQFFTPISSLKTYSKKPMKNNVAKNLEQEFFTPKPKEKVGMSKLPVKSKDTLLKKTLRRATSPGKLNNQPQIKDKLQAKKKPDAETRETRARRRKPVNFSLDDD